KFNPTMKLWGKCLISRLLRRRRCTPLACTIHIPVNGVEHLRRSRLRVYSVPHNYVRCSLTSLWG
ncbi:MAG: hypothetical protein RR254_02750, partial [Muribaculaceae bacterium]